MTQSNQPSDRDLFTRVVQLEYRLTRLENNQAQIENTMTPGGYITEAFDRVLDEIDTVKQQNQAQYDDLKATIAEQNGKIDLILRGITGLGNS
jgi:hypothetical protein